MPGMGVGVIGRLMLARRTWRFHNASPNCSLGKLLVTNHVALGPRAHKSPSFDVGELNQYPLSSTAHRQSHRGGGATSDQENLGESLSFALRRS